MWVRNSQPGVELELVRVGPFDRQTWRGFAL